MFILYHWSSSATDNWANDTFAFADLPICRLTNSQQPARSKLIIKNTQTHKLQRSGGIAQLLPKCLYMVVIFLAEFMLIKPTPLLRHMKACTEVHCSARPPPPTASVLSNAIRLTNRAACNADSKSRPALSGRT